MSSFYSVKARNLAIDGIASEITEVRLHTADPGSDGTLNEVTGGDPAYAPQAIAPGDILAGVDGEAILDAEKDIEFDGPAEEECPWTSYWDGNGDHLLNAPVITTGDPKFSGDGKFILKGGDTLFRARNPS